MKRTLYLTVLAIVTVLCVLCGSTFHIVGFLTHTILWPFSLVFSKSYDSSDLLESSGRTGDGTEVSGEFDSISIDAAALEIKIQTGSEYEISYSGPDSHRPTAQIEGGVLSVSQSGINWKKNSNGAELVITVPETVSLDTVSVDSAVADLKLLDLTADTLNLHVNVGAITLEGCAARSAEITGDMGDIEVKSCSLDDVSITCNMGGVACQKSAYSTISIDSPMGEIDLEYAAGTAYHIEAECGLGSIEIDGRHCGSSYSGDLGGAGSGSITLDCGMGAIEIKAF